MSEAAQDLAYRCGYAKALVDVVAWLDNTELPCPKHLSDRGVECVAAWEQAQEAIWLAIESGAIERWMAERGKLDNPTE